MAITVAAGDIILADHHNWLVPVTARKTSDETVNNSAVFQNDNDLALAVVANALYRMDGELHYNSGTTPDIKFQWTFPAGLTMKWSIYGPVSAFGGFSLTQAQSAGIDGAGVDRAVQVAAIVVVSSTAGTLQLQWAQNTANASDTKVLSGSYITLTRLS